MNHDLIVKSDKIYLQQCIGVVNNIYSLEPFIGSAHGYQLLNQYLISLYYRL